MRLALLTNFIPPYRVPLFLKLRERVGGLRIFISTAMEKDRPWHARWADLDVVVQKTWTRRRTWKHARFTQQIEMHVPYDTIVQLQRWRPDVVVSAEFGMRTVQALAYARMAGVPFIVWATLADHLEAGRGAARTLVRRIVVRLADRIIVNGESGARYIRSIGASESKISRVAQGVDVAPFATIALARPPALMRRLLYVGNVSQLKATDLLLEGLAIRARSCPNEVLHLTIVGDGPLRQSLEAQAMPENVSVEWARSVQYDELSAVYARAGLLIFPTLGDEWGLVVNEAMAAGLPVIGSTLSQAVDEMVADGKNGWRFEPAGAQAIADAIARALATPDDTLNRMRAHARDTATRFTTSTMADRFVSAVNEVRK